MTVPVPNINSSVSNRTISWPGIVLLVAALFLWLVQIGEYLNGTIDDVFITLRVANNVATGQGYVYNVGENIEGYSNWSWVTLIVLVGKAIGADSASLEMLWIAKILAMTFALFSLILVYWLTRKLTDSSFFASAAVLLTSATTTFGYWSICGLEAPFVLFLVTLSALLFYSVRTSTGYTAPILLGLTLATLAVTRPEGTAYGILLLATLLYLDRRISRQFVLLSLFFIIPLIVFLVWRYQMYGMLLPNTYYAKVGGGYRRFLLGFKYDLEALLACFGPILFFLLFARKSASYGAPSGRVRHEILLLAILYSLFGFFFAFYSGGDWMPAYRFIMPVLGLVIVLAICGLQYIYLTLTTEKQLLGSWSTYAIILFCLLSAGALTFEGRIRTKAQASFRIPHAMSMTPGYNLFDHWNTGKWLQAHGDSIKVFAAGEAGILGFLNPEKTLVDLNGLMDTTIARTKSSIGLDPEYVMDRNPDCIIIYRDAGPGMAVVGSLESYTDILKRNQRFRAHYALTDSIGVFAIYTRKGIANAGS